MLKLFVFMVSLVMATIAQQADAKVHRSHKAVTAFKRLNPCPANGRRTGICPGYWIDHVIPLACGGLDDPANMQWQTIRDAKAKDRWERKDCSIWF
jgi:hypothetical protein